MPDSITAMHGYSISIICVLWIKSRVLNFNNIQIKHGFDCLLISTLCQLSSRPSNLWVYLHVIFTYNNAWSLYFNSGTIIRVDFTDLNPKRLSPSLFLKPVVNVPKKVVIYWISYFAPGPNITISHLQSRIHFSEHGISSKLENLENRVWKVIETFIASNF